ncbi:MAG: ATP-binding protein [Bacteroidota bacterium]
MSITTFTWNSVAFLHCFLFCTVFSLAQSSYHLNLKHFGTEEGLSHRQVNCIHQDREGFIWVGTTYGLNRFNGYDFEWWTKEINGLTSNRIKNIIEDAEGYLWLIDQGSIKNVYAERMTSIDFLHSQTLEIQTWEEKFGAALPFSLERIYADVRTIGDDQTLYFGTGEGAHLISYHPQNGLQIFPIEDFQDFFPVAFTSAQTIWGIGDERTIIEVDTQGNILHQFPQKHPVLVRHIFMKEEALYFQLAPSQTKASYHVIGRDRKQVEIDIQDFLTTENRFSSEVHPYDILRYYSGNQLLWASNPPHQLLVQKDDYAFNILEEFPELKEGTALGRRKIYVDRERRIWLSGEFGLYQLKIEAQKFQRLLQSEEQANNIPTRGILQIGDTLLIGTDRSGLRIITPNDELVLQLPVDKIGQRTSFVSLKDHQNQLWGATDKLVKIDLKKQQFSTIENQEDRPVIWALHEDHQDRIWIGRIGLDYYDPRDSLIRPFQQYNEFEALANSRIIDFIPRKDGLIWLCTNTGLYELDIEKGITARYWTGGEGVFYLPNDDIRHIYEDEEGTYWIATGGSGLLRWNMEKIELQQFTRAHGLGNNFIYAIYEDGYNNLWMSSDQGIIRFNKTSHQSTTYLERDGITDNEFNRISHFQGADGRIYFGGLNGVTTFLPKDFFDLYSEDLKAPLKITKFEQFDGQQNKLLDKTGDLATSKHIVIYPNDRFFRLEFTLLSYEDASQVQYAYQIEGLDEDWNYQKERSLRFSQLPYGKHLLKIKGQAASGQWSEEELHVNIEVLKPIHLRTWFIALAALLTLLLLFGIYRFYLTRQLAKSEAENLKSLDALKSRFYTNITHEFRTPLTLIQGMTELENHPKAMQLIRRNSEKLLHLVNQLLDLSKLDTGKLKTQYKQIEVVSYIQYIGESFQSLADKKYIRLMIYSEIEELWMDVDEEKLRQIISNLLSNAIKFTNESGKIVLHLSRQNGELLLKVKDNGIGIETNEVAHIFDRFYQIDNAASQQGKGTGIGLSLVKELVELMDGKIEVQSTFGKGTTFNIQLPIRQISTLKTSEREAVLIDRSIVSEDINRTTHLNGTLPHLLLIEDNQDVVTYIQGLLEHCYQVSVANNGAKGIELALANIPDIILSDVMMPKKNGFEVVETLKQDERTSHIPIVLLTAKATQQDKIEGLQYGADAYLMKPFDKEELFIRLEKLLELRQSLQQKYATFTPITHVVKMESSNLEERFLQKLHEVVEKHYENSDFGVEELAKESQLSRIQLYRKLKAICNQTPSQFLRNFRLQKAKTLLNNPDLNISEVAYEVGFNDPAYFTRVFSKEFGQSPNAYRN